MSNTKIELFKTKSEEVLGYTDAIKKDGVYEVVDGSLPNHDYYMIVCNPTGGCVLPAFLRVATTPKGITGLFGISPTNQNHWHGATYRKTNKSLTLELSND